MRPEPCPEPCFAPSSLSEAGSRSMWQSMQVRFSTLSIRAMPLPVYALLRHMPGSSSPDRCTGIAMSFEMKPRWHPTHSSVPSLSSGTRTCCLCAATERASPSTGASIGVRDHR